MKEEDIILHYQKAQADKVSLEELFVRMEQAKAECRAAEERTGLLKQKKQAEAELACENERMEESRLRMLAIEEECEACRRQSEYLVEIYQKGTALEKQEREIRQQIAELSEQKKRFESYEGMKKNYERLTALLEEKSERQRRLEMERARMEQSYLYEQAGMLADCLVTGEACPVCGSREHPEPAVHKDGAPTKEELEAMRAECAALRDETAEISKDAAMEKSTMQLLLEHLNLSGENSRRLCSVEAYEQEEAGQRERLTELLEETEALVNEQKRCMEAKDRLPALEEKLAQERQTAELMQGALIRLKTNLQNIENEIKKITLILSTDGEEEAKERLLALQSEHGQKKREHCRR